MVPGTESSRRIIGKQEGGEIYMKKFILTVALAVVGLLGVLRAAQPAKAPAACCDGGACCDANVCCDSDSCCDGGDCCDNK